MPCRSQPQQLICIPYKFCRFMLTTYHNLSGDSTHGCAVSVLTTQHDNPSGDGCMAVLFPCSPHGVTIQVVTAPMAVPFQCSPHSAITPAVTMSMVLPSGDCPWLFGFNAHHAASRKAIGTLQASTTSLPQSLPKLAVPQPPNQTKRSPFFFGADK